MDWTDDMSAVEWLTAAALVVVIGALLFPEFRRLPGHLQFAFVTWRTERRRTREWQEFVDRRIRIELKKVDELVKVRARVSR